MHHDFQMLLTCFKYFAHLEATVRAEKRVACHKHSLVPAGYPFHGSSCGKRLSRQRQQAGMLEAISLSPGLLCCPDPAMSLTHTRCDGGLLILLKLALRPKAWLLSNRSTTQIVDIVEYSWRCHFIRVVAVPDSNYLPSSIQLYWNGTSFSCSAGQK